MTLSGRSILANNIAFGREITSVSDGTEGQQEAAKALSVAAATAAEAQDAIAAARDATTALRSVMATLARRPGVDWFKRFIDVATIIVLSVGLYFAWDQAKKLTESIKASNESIKATYEGIYVNNQSINLATAAGLGAHTTDINKMFVEHPELGDYFFRKKDAKDGDPNLARVGLMGGLMLDYFDTSWSVAVYARQHFDDAPVDLTGWETYIKHVFKTGPILCKTYLLGPDDYGTALKELADPICRPTKH